MVGGVERRARRSLVVVVVVVGDDEVAEVVVRRLVGGARRLGGDRVGRRRAHRRAPRPRHDRGLRGVDQVRAVGRDRIARRGDRVGRRVIPGRLGDTLRVDELVDAARRQT